VAEAVEAIVAGGFGGGHSSGGFSGGGRSSSGGFSSRGFGSSGPSGFHHDSPRPFFIGGPHYYYGGGPRYGYSSGWTFIIVFIVLMILMTYSINSLNTQNSTKVSKNTTQRTALSGVVSKTDWYEDNIGWVTSKSTLISGLEKFYKETGIQPYILFVPYSTTYWSGTTLQTSKADQYLEEVYSEKFTDEGHFIFAYFQCANDSKSEMDGEFRYLSGYSADTIMDSEAISILWGYFEKNYYNTSLSLEKMISNTFEETAESIMSKPTNAWDVAKVVIIIVAIIIVILIIYKIIKNKNSRAKEKEEYTKEILDKPLETFGTDTSELEKKYENNN
jgi:hypothetical protein